MQRNGNVAPVAKQFPMVRAGKEADFLCQAPDRCQRVTRIADQSWAAEPDSGEIRHDRAFIARLASDSTAAQLACAGSGGDGSFSSSVSMVILVGKSTQKSMVAD